MLRVLRAFVQIKVWVLVIALLERLQQQRFTVLEVAADWHDELMTLYIFTQLQSPHVHLLLSYFSFHVIAFHLVHGLSVSLPLKFGIPSLFTSGNHNHSPLSDVI